MSQTELFAGLPSFDGSAPPQGADTPSTVNHSHNLKIRSDALGRVGGFEVERVTGLSSWTINRRVKLGTFPPPLAGLTRRMWMEVDIRTWLEHYGPKPWTPWRPNGHSGFNQASEARSDDHAAR